MQLLDRGQSAVVNSLDDLLPDIVDGALLTDLRDMRAVHLANLARCAAVTLPATDP